MEDLKRKHTATGLTFSMQDDVKLIKLARILGKKTDLDNQSDTPVELQHKESEKLKILRRTVP